MAATVTSYPSSDQFALFQITGTGDPNLDGKLLHGFVQITSTGTVSASLHNPMMGLAPQSEPAAKEPLTDTHGNAL